MTYDLIVCGTGFASSFFLHKWLEKRPGSRVLVLERGARDDFWDQLEMGKNSSLESASLFSKSGLATKDWLFTVGLGGGSNCWWGQTPRMWPEDFQLFSRFGVGHDWPIGYDDLAPYYEEAEALISVAGPRDAPYPRRGACPQPAHNLSGFDRRMAELFPGEWVAAPTARASQPTDARGVCCANGVCGLCPVDAKFRVMNELASLYDETDAVELRLGAEVLAVNVEGGRATGITWSENGAERSARGELVFLGMNALFNPQVLKLSGDDSPLTGRRLNEQASLKLRVDFTDTDGFNGGSHITGLGYMFYGGEQRRDRGSVLIENYNAPAQLRSDRGKWTSRAVMKIVAENIPEDRNEVRLDEETNQPVAHFEDHSEYAKRALAEVPSEFIDQLTGVSPIEDVRIDSEIAPSEGHIVGTTVMSGDPADGVVDGLMRHHRIANLVVGGSGAFPSGPGTNPSLTIAALSLRSASALA
ncbi:GMC oxidoreductase [Tropicimonas marinistellae]|uniref:GMC oxidoreductase n=1 Tax=Tropicimonas marinistellae TaxID=1739787 RepID=UPI00082C1A2F|nr:GMC family oxidoreductase [Tropicimonas marinistellae]